MDYLFVLFVYFIDVVLRVHERLSVYAFVFYDILIVRVKVHI